MREECLEPLGSVEPHQRQLRPPPDLSLPDHPNRPLFTWSFVALEVRLFKGELALRIERHEVGPTRRKDLFHQACFRFLAGGIATEARWLAFVWLAIPYMPLAFDAPAGKSSKKPMRKPKE